MSLLRKNTYRFLSFLSFVALALVFSPTAFAASGGGNPLQTIFGSVSPPPGVAQYNDLVGGVVGGPDGERIGLFIFVSRAIQVFTIVAGLIVFFNFIIAGFTYISSEGNPKAHEEVKNRLTYSVIGLIIIVCAYTIIALLSLLIFGDASFILNPQIAGPTTP